MAIGLLTLELYLPLTHSLKQKRSILLPIKKRLQKDFNISICESDGQNSLSRAELSVVCVSQNSTHAHRLLQRVATFVEGWRMEAELIDYHIEML